jgi:tRNA(Met) cytidine acetyltransferase
MTDTLSDATAAAGTPAQGRSLVVLVGRVDETRTAAAALLDGVDVGRVWWVADGKVARGGESAKLEAMLGRECEALVLSAHGGVDGETLGRCHGFVRGGGVLMVRVDAGPYARRFDQRFMQLLLGAADRIWQEGEPIPARVELLSHATVGTAEQAALVAELAAAMGRALGPGATPCVHVVTAHRGRGKSAAIGLALQRVANEAFPGAVVAASADADGMLEMQRFSESCAVTWTTPGSLLEEGLRPAIILIDEAARVPIAMLRRVVERHAGATFVFATTTHGYEGTGRGFVLKFQRWLRESGRVVIQHRLDTPIRWCSNDRLERFVFDVLLLDAEAPSAASLDEGASTQVVRLDRDGLARDEVLLRGVFGLLVQAHYRTTPRDLEVLLDGTNVELHAATVAGGVVGVCLVAHEGQLDATTTAAALAGRVRLAGHALADCLVAHMGLAQAGPLTMVRSVRIATHPELRRRGVARLLVEAVHAAYRPDLFGTLFGADAGLIGFRRALGYELVRVSAARGARTGEPAVMMLRAASAAGEALLAVARAAYVRDAAERLAYLKADHELVPDVALEKALLAGVDGVADSAPNEELALLQTRVAAWLDSPRTFEQACGDLRSFVVQYRHLLVQLSPRDAALVEARVIGRLPWAEAARVAGLAHSGQAMRRLRPALRALYEAAVGADGYSVGARDLEP